MANSPSWHLARTLQHDFFWPVPLVCFTCSRWWHSDSDTVSSSSVSAISLVCFTCPRGGTTSSSSSSAWCGPAPVPALGHQRVPNRGAVDKCSDAVILADVLLVADILVAVVDREIEASRGAAPEVVEVRDGCPRTVGDFRRVSVQQPSAGSSSLSRSSSRTAMSSTVRSSRSSMVRSP